MAAYVGDGGGAWSTFPVRSCKAAPLAPSPRGGDDSAPGSGELAEAVEGLEIGGDGERRLDKYDIPVEVSGEGAPPPADGFEAAGLAEAVLRNVARCGYESPTPVQRYAMPIAMAGRDLMACARAGSGKTAAFCLPVVSGLVAGAGGYGRRDKGSFERTAKPRALVLAPTAELAAQINEEATKFSLETGLMVVVAYDGTPMYDQLRDLERGVDLLVATPGRLVDMVERSWISLEAIKYLVMDEADRMLDMGFEPQIRKIVNMMNLPKNSARQTMLFSVTFTPEIQKLAYDFLHNYIFITAGRVGSSTDLIDQKIDFVNGGEKRGFLLELLHKQSVGMTHSKPSHVSVKKARSKPKVWISLWMVAIISTYFVTNADALADKCPKNNIASFILPRNQCPAIHVESSHWLHEKREYPEFRRAKSHFIMKCTHLLDILVFLGCIATWTTVWNLSPAKQLRFFSFNRKLVHIWIDYAVASIVYYACWAMHGYFLKLSLDDHGKHIATINSVACAFSVVLLLLILSIHRKSQVQWYLHYHLLILCCTVFLCSLLWNAENDKDRVSITGFFGCTAMIVMYTFKWATIMKYKQAVVLLNICAIAILSWCIDINDVWTFYGFSCVFGLCFRVLETGKYCYLCTRRG